MVRALMLVLPFVDALDWAFSSPAPRGRVEVESWSAGDLCVRSGRLEQRFRGYGCHSDELCDGRGRDSPHMALGPLRARP
jgi:hypothetical protein